jgi:hypothetical protein
LQGLRLPPKSIRRSFCKSQAKCGEYARIAAIVFTGTL